MTNLLEETLKVLKYLQIDEEEVAWVGSDNGAYAIPWGDFKKIASKTNYDGGYGGQEIAEDLVVVFKDNSWLERQEYDGSEWWSYKKAPERQKKAKTFTRVMGEWSEISLDRCNKEREEEE